MSGSILRSRWPRRDGAASTWWGTDAGILHLSAGFKRQAGDAPRVTIPCAGTEGMKAVYSQFNAKQKGKKGQAGSWRDAPSTLCILDGCPLGWQAERRWSLPSPQPPSEISSCIVQKHRVWPKMLIPIRNEAVHSIPSLAASMAPSQQSTPLGNAGASR